MHQEKHEIYSTLGIKINENEIYVLELLLGSVSPPHMQTAKQPQPLSLRVTTL